MVSYLLKIAYFDLIHLHLSHLTAFEFRPDLWRHKTRVPGLSYGVVCAILCLAILIQY